MKSMSEVARWEQPVADLPPRLCAWVERLSMGGLLAADGTPGPGVHRDGGELVGPLHGTERPQNYERLPLRPSSRTSSEALSLSDPAP